MNLKCTCTHEHQDKKFGEGVRIHELHQTDEGMFWRCRICNDLKPFDTEGVQTEVDIPAFTPPTLQEKLPDKEPKKSAQMSLF